MCDRHPMWLESTVLLSLIFLLTANASATAADAGRGYALARANCAVCHAVEKNGASPNNEAPPFRVLHQRYPVESLEEALAEGIVTGHSDMPEFKLEPDEIGDFIAYLRTLE